MSTIFNPSLTTNGDGFDGYTFVQRITTAGLTLSGSITRIRITFQAAAAQGCTVTNSYIGHAAAAGDAYDFLATPVPILFGGSATKVIAAGTSETSDWAEFSYNQTSDLLVAVYTNGGTGSDAFKYVASGITGATTYERAATNEAATVNKTTGYTATGGAVYGINKIEIEAENSATFFF